MTMNNADDLMSCIDAMIAMLSSDLSNDDRRCGWTESSRKAIRIFFEQMRIDVMKGESIVKMPQYTGIVRGLDHWGVTRGRLFEKAATIAKIVRQQGQG